MTAFRPRDDLAAAVPLRTLYGLTAVQAQLLAYLVETSDATRAGALRAVYGEVYPPRLANTFAVHLKNLRTRIAPLTILTVSRGRLELSPESRCEIQARLREAAAIGVTHLPTKETIHAPDHRRSA